MKESFAALREREFRLRFTGQLISLLGDSFSSVACALAWTVILLGGPLAAGIGTSATLWVAAVGSFSMAAVLVATPSVRALTA